MRPKFKAQHSLGVSYRYDDDADDDDDDDDDVVKQLSVCWHLSCLHIPVAGRLIPLHWPKALYKPTQNLHHD